MAASVKIADRYGYAHAPASLVENAGGLPEVINSSDEAETPRLRIAKLAVVEKIDLRSDRPVILSAQNIHDADR